MTPDAKPSIEVRPGDPADAVRLTELVMASKSSWGYTKHEMEVFRAELRIDAARLARSPAFVAWIGDAPAGVCTLAELSSTRLSLEHLFVSRDQMGRGVGRALIRAAVACARASGHALVEIWSDPNATGFYSAIGARGVGETPSRIAGRALPVFLLDVADGQGN